MNVLVMGMGKSGIGAMKVLFEMGEKVSIYDSKSEDKISSEVLEYIKDKDIRTFFGIMPNEPFDKVVLSPGINPSSEDVKKLEELGAEITGELELAYEAGHGTYAAITGTNGKTTVTTLMGEIFAAAFGEVHVAGNIGVAVTTEASSAGDDAWMVTECSSFQLETVKEFHPHIGVFLNLTPDHLNRHIDMEGYGRAKSKMFMNQTSDDYLIYNGDDEYCVKLCADCDAVKVPFSRKKVLDFGAFAEGNDLYIYDGEKKEKICSKDELKIIGEHNVENVLAASAAAYFAGADISVIRETVISFKGVEHRIEFSGEICGVKYYNDSKGTNTDATITAIKAVKENILLLAGGDSKKQEFASLAKELKGAVKHVFLYGRDLEDIRIAMEAEGYSDYSICNDLYDAVVKAKDMASFGDSILLSPACASWDAYKSFEERGEHFKNIVSELEK